jgi:hypothetical protein
LMVFPIQAGWNLRGNVWGHQQDILNLLLKETNLQQWLEKLKAPWFSWFMKISEICEERVYNDLNLWLSCRNLETALSKLNILLERVRWFLLADIKCMSKTIWSLQQPHKFRELISHRVMNLKG